MTDSADTTSERLAGLTIAVLGGTGPQGQGLARRFAAGGCQRRANLGSGTVSVMCPSM
jgi:hypothetical protein